MKTIEQCEREFSNAVQEFINAAVAKGHSLETAKVMARDVVARAVRKTFKVVSPELPVKTIGGIFNKSRLVNLS